MIWPRSIDVEMLQGEVEGCVTNCFSCCKLTFRTRNVEVLQFIVDNLWIVLLRQDITSLSWCFLGGNISVIKAMLQLCKALKWIIRPVVKAVIHILKDYSQGELTICSIFQPMGH
jgi:hypothetical protein